MRLLYFIFIFSISWSFLCQNDSIVDNSKDCYQLNKTREDGFGIKSIEKRIIDNKGLGDDRLIGTRNFRAVLYNLVYRGGGNNFHLKDTIPKYYLWNPMPLYGIKQLISSGFDQAVYLYSYNFDYWYSKNRIDSLKDNGFIYRCEPALDKYLPSYFNEVLAHANDSSSGYIYIHCWNGWHQSGLLSAYSLMQFCDFTNLEALKYWEKCTDGHYKGYRKVKNRIRNYTPSPSYTFTKAQKQKHCPCNKDFSVSESINKKDEINLKEGEMMQKSNKNGFKYIVKSGDSLYKIAKKYNTDISTLKSINGIKSDIIYVNQVLRIPVP